MRPRAAAQSVAQNAARSEHNLPGVTVWVTARGGLCACSSRAQSPAQRQAAPTGCRIRAVPRGAWSSGKGRPRGEPAPSQAMSLSAWDSRGNPPAALPRCNNAQARDRRSCGCVDSKDQPLSNRTHPQPAQSSVRLRFRLLVQADGSRTGCALVVPRPTLWPPPQRTAIGRVEAPAARRG